MPVTDTPSTAPRLVMHQIDKRFGATHALRGVSLEARPGEVLALIGENGAGKSTLMKVLSGALQADGGQMHVDGRPYHPRGPLDARRAGVAMIYQELNLAPDLSVEDNVMLGQERMRWGLLCRGQQRRLVRSALEQLGHGDLPLDVPVKRLSLGSQQLVEIARALVLKSRVIIFDEPTSSLPQHDVQRLFDIIRRLRAQQLAIVYISHFLEEIRQIADRFAVLRDGQTAGVGELASVDDRQIVALMTGRNVAELFPQVPHEPQEVVLRAERLAGTKSPSHVSFELRRGEIFGLFGLVGAGRTETLRCLFGLDRLQRGRMSVRERTPTGGPRSRIRAGMAMVSEDRKCEGLAQQLSISDNLTLSYLRPYSQGGLLRLRKRRKQVREWMQRLGIKARHEEQPVAALSGGNQQKVAIARVLHQEADILLLDEPTRGIDVGTKSEIYRWMGELAAAGKAIVFVSSYIPELLAVCDRVGVMVRGRLVQQRPVGEWSEEDLLAAAIAGDLNS